MTWDHSGDHMAARSAFLKLVSSDPAGDSLMQAFARGPMAIYGPHSAAVYQVSSQRTELVLAGSFGFSERIGNYQSLPLGWDLPVTRAFHTGQVIVVPTQEIDEKFPLLSPWPDLVLHEYEVEQPSTIVAMPLVYSGTIIGVCAIVCSHQKVWTWFDYAFMEGMCAAVALWQHINMLNESLWLAQSQNTQFRRRPRGLKERQVQVLELLAEGKSNASIAKSLGFSLSTVKADVQMLLELLGAKTRSDAVERAMLAGLIPAAGDVVSDAPVA